jgi:hypothetical protein
MSSGTKTKSRSVGPIRWKLLSRAAAEVGLIRGGDPLDQNLID